MKARLNRFAPLLLMLVFPFLGMMYQIVNKPDDQIYSMMTNIDAAIPFIKYFAVPYSIWIFYIYACLVYFFFKDVRVYLHVILTYILCTLICYGIYMMFQTTVPRPIIAGNDPFTLLTMYIYNRDLPFNCFPSIHCFSCYMVMKALAMNEFRTKRNMTFIFGMSSLIIVSTFFLKQHAILDAFAGFMLVELIYPIVVKYESLARTWRQKQPSNTFDA
jgi:hypothetical protein